MHHQSNPSICQQCGTIFNPDPWYVRRGKGRYCSTACYGNSIRQPLVERFWSKVNKTDFCWLWTGGITKSTGYGKFYADGKTWGAHRFAWMLTWPYPLLPTHFVCHNCPGGDNRTCVRPSHLFIDVQAGNIRDAAAKGMLQQGDRHHAAKMTAEIVREIRRAYAAGGCTQADLARRFGISETTVGHTLNGRIWTHVA